LIAEVEMETSNYHRAALVSLMFTVAVTQCAKMVMVFFIVLEMMGKNMAK
jgi:hypothetical protein